MDKIYVASGAIIPIFAFPRWQYTKLKEVLLYPDRFNHMLGFDKNEENRMITGMVGSGGAMDTIMILSKPALHQGFEIHNDKSNVAIHEFLHLIDKEDFDINGVPSVLLNHNYSSVWMEYVRQNIEAIHNNESDIRDYAGTNPSEFFAVIGEYFFEQPDLLERKHPKLYEMLHEKFQQDPGKPKAYEKN